MRTPLGLVAAPVLPACSRGLSVRLCSPSSAAGPAGGWEEYHVPVLRDELVRWLVTDPAGTYADLTLGGGGHSAALLDVLAPAGGRLVCADRDGDAIRQARRRLGTHVESGAATLLQTSFGRFPAALSRAGVGVGAGGAPGEGAQLSGVLLDLGVSSHQIDEASRGFSMRFEGPLDMRMDQASGELTAATILNEWSAAEIADVLWRHGEERLSRPLSRALVAARPLRSTAQLASVVKAAQPGAPKELTKRAARVFQALRIEVNAEMDELEAILAAAASLVRPGGRLAVMSYHSLEDRRVKRLLRSGATSGDSPPRDFYGNSLAPWTPLTRQPVFASDAEIEANPRARSVRLRVGERSSHPTPEAAAG